MQLCVILSEHSLKPLKNEKFALYLFKAIRYGPTIKPLAAVVGFGGGYPLVWCRKSDYFQRINIDWDDKVEAYITGQRVKEKIAVRMGNHIPTAVGQTVKVNNGEMDTAVGSAGVIQINNEGTQKFFCGLARTVDSSLAPTCAFPLHGINQIMITPTDKVLVMFAPVPAEVSGVGTAVTTAWNHGLLVTFDGPDCRTVNYDIDSGWSANNAVWAERVDANQDLGALLIIPSNRS